jgi:hypothetical protein
LKMLMLLASFCQNGQHIAAIEGMQLITQSTETQIRP